MKKYLILLLCAVFLMSSFASFAEAETATPANQEAVTAPTVETVTDATPTDQLVQAATGEEQVSEADVDALVKIDGIEEIEAEQNSVVSSIYNVNEINADNAAAVLAAVKKYLTVRDKYYKAVLLKLRAINQTQNKALARRAIIKFEGQFKVQAELDRKIHSKIEKVLKYINKNANKGKSNKKEISGLRDEFKPILLKYYQHRKLIIQINNQIRKLKIALFKEQVKKMEQLATQLEKAKKFNAAIKLYDEALKKGDNDKSYFKKISELNKKIGKTAPGIYVGKKKVTANVDPVVKEGTTLVPLRAISEALDAAVNYDPKTKTITITKGDKVVKLTLGSKEISINGEKKTISQAANTISGTTMVPLRSVSETLDSTVGWDPQTSTITVDDNLTTTEGTISAEEAEESGVVSSSDVSQDATGEQAVEDLLNGTN